MPANSHNQDLLSSWKEIAVYLGCDERTCRRWELEFGLPVHRMEGASKSRVYAYKVELDAWQKSRLNGNQATVGTATAVGTAVSEPPSVRLEGPRGTTGLALRAKSKKRLILWSIPLAAIIVATVLWVRSSRGQPADFRIQGSKLIILNEKGKKLGEFDSGLQDLESEEYYRKRFQKRWELEGGGYWLPQFVIRDIDKDGKVEVLFPPKTPAERNETGIFCLDHKGRVLWHYKPGRELRFGDHLYSADYRIFGLETCDLNGDGLLEVLLITAHQPHSPSELIVLSCRGKILGEFINWGQIRDILCADLTSDSKPEVIAAGMNDEYGRGFAALFDSSRISGSSPQSESYMCEDCNRGSEIYYVLFPRTDVDTTLKPDKLAIEAIHLLNDKRIELLTQISHLFFELDYRFAVQDVKASDIFRNQHRELKAAGKISSELNDAYYEALKKGVLYWDGAQWTSTPTKNQSR